MSPPFGRAVIRSGRRGARSTVSQPRRAARSWSAAAAAAGALALGLALAYAARVRRRGGRASPAPERRAPDRLPSDYGLVYEAVTFPSRSTPSPWRAGSSPPARWPGTQKGLAARRPRRCPRVEPGARWCWCTAAAATASTSWRGASWRSPPPWPSDGHRVLVFDLRGYGALRRDALLPGRARGAGRRRRGRLPGPAGAGAGRGRRRGVLHGRGQTGLLFAAEEPRVRAVAATAPTPSWGEVLADAGAPAQRPPAVVHPGDAGHGPGPDGRRPHQPAPGGHACRRSPLGGSPCSSSTGSGTRGCRRATAGAWPPPTAPRRRRCSSRARSTSGATPPSRQAYLARLLPFLARADEAGTPPGPGPGGVSRNGGSALPALDGLLVPGPAVAPHDGRPA